DARIARELEELCRRERFAEEEAREVRQVVRLVEDERVGGAEELRRAFLAQRQVGEEEMVVDDADLGVGCALARLHHAAIAVVAARGPQAVLAGRRYLAPRGRGLRDIHAIRAVP